MAQWTIERILDKQEIPGLGGPTPTTKIDKSDMLVVGNMSRFVRTTVCAVSIRMPIYVCVGCCYRLCFFTCHRRRLPDDLYGPHFLWSSCAVTLRRVTCRSYHGQLYTNTGSRVLLQLYLPLLSRNMSRRIRSILTEDSQDRASTPYSPKISDERVYKDRVL